MNDLPLGDDLPPGDDPEEKEKKRRERKKELNAAAYKKRKLDPEKVAKDKEAARKRSEKVRKDPEAAVKVQRNNRERQRAKRNRDEAESMMAKRDGFHINMTETPTDDQLLDHDTREGISEAHAFFWKLTNGGLFRDARQIAALQNIKDSTLYTPEEQRLAQARIDVLKAEIRGEIFSRDDCVDRLEAYQDRVMLTKQLLSCGACGIRSYTSKFHECSLRDQFIQLLKLNTAQIEEHERLGEFKAVSSVYVDRDGDHFFLHPEVVRPEKDGHEPTVTVCEECLESMKRKMIPELSVANGLDFGDLSRLPDLTIPPLTLVELHICSPARLYSSILKLTTANGGSVIHGHVLVMRHDGPEKASRAIASLPYLEAAKTIEVVFVGSKVDWDNKSKKQALGCRELQVRATVVNKFLRLKKAIDPQYSAITIKQVHDLSKVTEELVKEAVVIDDPQAIRIDAIVTDDVAGVRVLEKNDACPKADDLESVLGEPVSNPKSEGEPAAVKQQEPIISYAFLRQPDNESEGSASNRVLRAIAKTLDPRIKVSKAGEALNEFEENDSLYLETFPHLFLFGRGVPTKGPLPGKFVDHLLHQRTTVFAKDQRFLFTAFNQRQRHQNARAASGIASKHPLTAEKLGNLVNDPAFKEKVESAVENPSSAEARELLKEVSPLVSLTSSKADFSPAARGAALTTLYAYVQYYGFPSVFLTVAPDDTHSVLSVRATITGAPVDCNNHFPATDSGFLDELRKGGTTFTIGEIDISEHALQRLIADNPVAATEIFKVMIEAIWCCLLGLPPDRDTRKTFPPGTLPKGIFGHTRAFYSVIETQGRLSLHVHMLIWAGLQPKIIQKCAAYDDLMAIIREVLDSQFVATLSPLYHYRSLLRLATEPKKREPLQPVRVCYQDAPIPRTAEGEAQFKAFSQEVMNRCGVHQHSFSCEKGAFGNEGCRLSFPRHTADITGPVQLSIAVAEGRANDEKAPKNEKKKFEYHISHIVDVEELMVDDVFNFPLPPQDLRCILVDHCRPLLITTPIEAADTGADREEVLRLRKIIEEMPDKDTRGIILGMIESRNRAVVESSPTASAALGCNVAAYVLGSTEQAKSVLFYLLKYITKDKMALTNSLSVLKYALEKVNTHESKAEDKGTDLRTGKYLLSVAANRITGMTEVAATQAAVSLLGMPAQEGSAKTAFVHVASAIADVRSRELEWAGQNPATAWNEEIIRGDHLGVRSATPDANGEEEEDAEFDTLDYHWGMEVPSLSKAAEPQSENLFEELMDDTGVHQDTRVEFGGAAIYHVKDAQGVETLVPVPQHVHYANRGEHLEQLSLVAYACVIEVVAVKKREGEVDEDLEEEQRQGQERQESRRRPNTTYEFDVHHPLHLSHVQRTRSKLLIPVLTGVGVPTLRYLDSRDNGYSNISDAAKAELEREARYLLTILSPWTLQKNPGSPQLGEKVPRHGTNWTAFSAFCRELRGLDNPDERPTFLGDAILGYIENITRGLRVNSINKKMLVMYRGQAATRWKDADLNVCNVVKYFNQRWAGQTPDSAHMGHGQGRKEEEEEFADDAKVIERLRDLARQDDPDYQPTKEEKTAHYLQASGASLLAVFDDDSEGKGDSIMLGAGGVTHSDIMIDRVSETEKGVCEDLWDRLKDKEEKPLSGPGADEPEIRKKRRRIDDDEAPSNLRPSDEMKPNSDQTNVLNVIQRHIERLQSKKSSDPFILLIHGGPGVGKTWTVNKARELFEAAGMETVSTAFTGSAATMIPTAETMHSLVSLNTRDPDNVLSPLNDKAMAAAEIKLRDKSILIIDEVSMVSSVMLGKLHQRLSEIRKSQLPFGGMSLLMVGDFLQLKPVRGSGLYSDLVDLHLGKSSGAQVQIHTNVFRTQGLRLFSQAKLLDLKEQVRAASDPVQVGFISKMRDLNEKESVSSALLQSLQEHTLTAEDVRKPGWDEAPLCVTSNQERAHLTPLLATAFAKRHQVPVITWNLPAKGEVLERLRRCGASDNEVYRMDSGLVGIYVKDAPAYITENINTRYGLANGTPVRMHSLAFTEMGRSEEAELRAIIAQAAPGQRVHLPRAPSFINVTVALPPHVQGVWPSGQSLVDDSVVLPIGLCSQKVDLTVTHGVGTQEFSGRVRAQNHRVELGFVVTFHKIQGKTVNKIVLELNHRPFQPQICFNSLLVAISRVTNRENLRILKARSATSLQYLRALHPDPKLAIWLSGFDDAGNWSAERMIQRNKQPLKKGAHGEQGKGKPIRKQQMAKKGKQKEPETAHTLPPPAPPPAPPPTPLADGGSGFPWMDNSCHIDSFLEGCYAALLSAPLPPWIEELPQMEGLDWTALLTPTDKLKVAMQIRHHSPQLSSGQLHSFRNLLRHHLDHHPYEGRAPHSTGIPHWVNCFSVERDTDFGALHGITFLRRKVCSCGEFFSERNEVDISLPAGQGFVPLGEAFAIHFHKPSVLCDTCGDTKHRPVADPQVPPIVVVNTNTKFSLGETVSVLGRQMRVMAAVRVLDSGGGVDHFVVYVWRQGEVFFYNDMAPQNGVLCKVNIQHSDQMTGQPDTVFLGWASE